MKKQSLVVLLLLLFVFAMAGCSGSDGAAGAAGAAGATGATGSDGTSGAGAATGVLTASIDSVTSAVSGTGQAFTVNFTVKDASGALISNLTETSSSDAGQRLSHLRLTAAKLTAGAATGDATHWTSYFQGERSHLRLTDNGNGTYAYTSLPFDAALYEASAHSRVGLQIYNLTGIDPLNLTFDFAPDGTAITVTRDVVTTAACAACHDTGNPIAHGSRYETKFCVTCHNAETSRNGHTVDFKSLIHEIHTGQTTSALDASGVAFPQDVRNCTTCHKGTDAIAPTIEACGSCHTTVNFATGANHTGGIKTNAQCSGCHDSEATIYGYHQSNYKTTNNAGLTGADNFEYVISSVTLTDAGTEYKTATIVFQILNNGTPINLATDFTGTNLTVGGGSFLKGPSIGINYAYAQDGITNPSDWNVRGPSTTLSGLIAGTSGTVTGTTTMTAVLSGSTATAGAIPNGATMVTAYMSGSFIDQNWAAKETAAGRTVSEPTGSARPGKAALKTATGQTARRTIADASKCNSCHEQLGTEPYFHSGSYNIVMCAGCHTPNQTSSGWTASFRAWVHGIHGASKRTVPYTWHAVSATETYAEIEYPGKLSDCEQCHLAGTYDFSASVYTANSGTVMDRMLVVSTATGTFASTSTTSYRFSPYVALDNGYGSGYSLSIGANTNVAPTVTATGAAVLYSTPITATCSACHDSADAISHMQSNGGAFYGVRGASATLVNNESCMVCHGPGKLAAIADMHK